MKERPVPVWLAEAKAMSARGLRTAYIARKIGVKSPSVAYWLNLNGEQERQRELRRLRDVPGDTATGVVAKLVKKWEPRPKPKQLDPEYIRSISRRVARGEIDLPTFKRLLWKDAA